jgi:caa(3)-type oxidase subunit IV
MSGKSGRPYVATWLALLAATGISYAVDLLRLGAIGLGISLAIAGLKATIVGLVFMHLARETFAARVVAVLNVGWVALICLGIIADVAFR